jgi:hypothetical protein
MERDEQAGKPMNEEIAERPSAAHGKSQLLFSGMKRLPENVVLNLQNKSHAVTAEIEVPQRGAKGVIIAQGSNSGGWSLYAHEGRLKYCYNMMGSHYAYVGAYAPLPAGRHQVRMEMAYDGGLGKGGAVTLYVDGKVVGAGRVERTHPFGFALGATTDIGCDLGSPVSTDYGPRGNAFNGDVAWVQLDTGPEDVDQFSSAEERL